MELADESVAFRQQFLGLSHQTSPVGKDQSRVEDVGHPRSVSRTLAMSDPPGMRISDSVRVLVSRFQAGAVDRDTAVEQIKVVLEQTNVEPAELVMTIVDDDLKQVARIRADAAERSRNNT